MITSGWAPSVLTSRTIPRSRMDRTGTSGSFTCPSSDHIVAGSTTRIPDKLVAEIASPPIYTPILQYAGLLCHPFASTDLLLSSDPPPQILPAPFPSTWAAASPGLRRYLHAPAAVHNQP